MLTFAVAQAALLVRAVVEPWTSPGSDDGQTHPPLGLGPFGPQLSSVAERLRSWMLEKGDEAAKRAANDVAREFVTDPLMIKVRASLRSRAPVPASMQSRSSSHTCGDARM